ncbi:T9SS type A sorting domain-containing protein [Sanyastnella coralliicola]|uniref:T9SS type A sorting domain-containing protein n=1 Tax=Sanyastnella coralliicola TaxID=3069118 RepID=UPI0027B89FD2|nr:T9SS type A sorting domain-containing protein [Longitalea sp. SCSIO 12813]
MKNWKFVISVFLSSITLGGISQGFNNRYEIGEAGGLTSGIVEADGSFFVLGGGFYEESQQAMMLQISQTGDLMNEVPAVGPFYWLAHWDNDWEIWNDELFINTGFTVDSAGFQRLYIGFWNHDGEVVDTIFHYSPLFDPDAEEPMDWYRAGLMTLDDDQNIFTVNAMVHPFKEVAKFDDNGLKLWSTIIEDDPDWIGQYYEGIIHHEGVVYVGLDYIDGVAFEAGGNILRFDAETGTQLESIVNNANSPDGIFDMMVLDNGDLIIASGFTHPEQGWRTPGVGRINEDGDILWNRIFGDGEQGEHPEMKVLVDNGDDTFTVAGNYVIIRDEPDDVLGWADRFGILAKLDFNGNVIWSHTYSGILAWTEENTINDMIATSDGGYIFCGESRETDLNNPNYQDPGQQGWVVKVDEFGCVEPGCEYVNVEEIMLGLEQAMSIAPNPSNGIVNLSFNLPNGYTPPSNTELRVFDLTGALVFTEQLSTPNSIQLNLQHLANGHYIMHWMTLERLFDSISLVIAK